MVPKIHTSRSFEEVSDYLLHDKKARTQERVEWVELENLRLSCPEDAWKQMSRTVENANTLKAENGFNRGRSRGNPACHLSLSWANDEQPEKDEMLSAGREVLKMLGLETHQALLVCHNDEPHPHIHILVNRVNRENGLTNSMSRSKRKLSEWAMNYELGQGQIRCETRVENNKALKEGKKPRHRDTVIKKAWDNSQTGAQFQKLLAEEGYTLARGKSRIVVVDREGKAVNPTRQLYGVKAADIKAKLADLDLQKLPDAEDVRGSQKTSKAKDETRRRKASGEKRKAGATDRQEQKASPITRRQVHETVGRKRVDRAREDFNVYVFQRVEDDNQRRNTLELAQLDQIRKLEARHSREREAKDKELADFYRLEEKRQKLNQLKSVGRLSNADKQRVAGLRRSLAGAERREHQARAQLTHQQEQERQTLKLVQQRELEELGHKSASRGPVREPVLERTQQPTSEVKRQPSRVLEGLNTASLQGAEAEQMRRNAFELAQLDQTRQLEARHSRERDAKDKDLAAFYCLEEKREELNQLESAGRLSTTDEQKVAGLRMSLADTQRREHQARAQLIHQQEEEREGLKATQQRELEGLEREIASRSRSPAPPKHQPRQDKEQRLAGNDNGPLAAMMKRHELEQRNLEISQQEARADLQEQLEQRFQLKEKSNELEQLEGLEQPSIEQRERMDTLRQNVADAGRQIDTQWYTLTFAQGEQQTHQELRHTREQAELERKLSLTKAERDRERERELEAQRQRQENTLGR